MVGTIAEKLFLTEHGAPCVQASLAAVPAAMQNFAMAFTGPDPVQQGWWRCIDSADEACAAAQLQPSPDLCSLPRSSWAWTNK